MKVIKQSFKILPEGELVKQIEERGRLCYKSEDKITKTSANKFVKHKIVNGHSSVLEMGVIHLRLTCPSASIAYAYLEELRISNQKFLFADSGEGPNVWITGSVRSLREWIINCANHGFANAAAHFLVDEHPILFGDLTLSDEVPYSSLMVFQEVSSALPGELRFTHEHVAVHFDTNRAVTHEMVRHRPCTFLQESQRYCRYADDVVFIAPTAFKFSNSDMAIWQDAMQTGEDNYLALLKNNSPQAARTALPNSCKTEIIVYCNLREWSHIFKLRTSEAAEPSMQEAMKPLLAEMKPRFPGVFDELQIAVG